MPARARGLLLACLLAATSSFAAQAPPRIGRITIETHPVFNAQESSRGGFYRAVNLLHVQTPESLIRRFLLFHEGDVYDAAKLAETERNLRRFEFLTSASVTASPPHDGVVDVVVRTADAWTTDVTGHFSNQGGINIYNVDVAQRDLLGSGSTLDLRAERNTERRTNAVEFLSPAALGAYWNLDALYARSSDGDEQKIALERPL